MFKKLLNVSSFILGNFAILVLAFALITIFQTTKTSALDEPAKNSIQQLSDSDFLLFNSVPTPPPQPIQSIVSGDARIKIVDQFFRRYSSPMTGLGRFIVQTADKYQIPFNLLPAIATCEGNAGKTMPKDSFNTYGWGIYGTKVTRFSSWEEGIETVSAGLKKQYFDKGLTTPEAIMAKYTPPSEGSWAFCVKRFMGEMQ